MTAAAAFGAVVVLMMLASKSFDPAVVKDATAAPRHPELG